jgi:hypothetical protein
MLRTTIDELTTICLLTPKERSPTFGSFLKFGQAIADEIFVQKISIFW